MSEVWEQQATYRIAATTLGDLLDGAGDRWSHQAVVFEDGEGATFPELAEMALRRGRELCALGVERGDKVGILMPNSLEYIASVFGAAKLGAIPVPVNSRFSSRELCHVLVAADARVLLTAPDQGGSPDYPNLISEAIPDLAEARDPGELRLDSVPALRQVASTSAGEPPGFLPVERLRSGGEDVSPREVVARQRRVRIRDTALIMFTSGTTASPKGCMLNHEGLTRSAHLVARTRFFLRPDDRLWDPMPFFHMSTWLPLAACLTAGSTFLPMKRFEAGTALRQMERERCTFAYPCFEAITTSLLEHPLFRTVDLSRITRTLNVGLPEQLERAQKAMPHAIQLSSYGMTEATGVLTYNSPDDPPEKRIYALGRPFEGMEVRVVDPETGRELQAGERGEIQYRGYARFDGYYGDPEATAAIIDRDGWVHSGDLCSIDGDGFVTFHGRIKDMLKVGGENVAAAEVEGALIQHPAVRIAQVVGAPDARYGEVGAAFVELHGGADVDQDELIEHCVSLLAKYKVPRYVRVVEEWPMSGTKVQKHRLRERIALELAELGVDEAPHIEALERRR